MIAEAREGLADLNDPEVRRHYEQLIRSGMPEKHARRLCHGKWQGLALNTDTTFFAGRGDGFHGDTPASNFTRKMAKRRAEAAGVNITGKHYFPSLADSPMDPKAWVDSRSDLARLANERGVGIEGAGIKVDCPEPPPEEDKPYEVANDIVAKRVAETESEVGGLSPRERGELFMETKERLSGGQETVDSLEERVE
jgi:hypothetical protein